MPKMIYQADSVFFNPLISINDIKIHLLIILLPMVYYDVHHPEQLSGKELDDYLAKGW